jgi:hypothetical protein
MWYSRTSSTGSPFLRRRNVRGSRPVVPEDRQIFVEPLIDQVKSAGSDNALSLRRTHPVWILGMGFPPHDRIGNGLDIEREDIRHTYL